MILNVLLQMCWIKNGHRGNVASIIFVDGLSDRFAFEFLDYISVQNLMLFCSTTMIYWLSCLAGQRGNHKRLISSATYLIY